MPTKAYHCTGRDCDVSVSLLGGISAHAFLSIEGTVGCPVQNVAYGQVRTQQDKTYLSKNLGLNAKMFTCSW